MHLHVDCKCTKEKTHWRPLTALCRPWQHRSKARKASHSLRIIINVSMLLTILPQKHENMTQSLRRINTRIPLTYPYLSTTSQSRLLLPFTKLQSRQAST